MKILKTFLRFFKAVWETSKYPRRKQSMIIALLEKSVEEEKVEIYRKRLEARNIIKREKERSKE
jgi:hypothetical protein